MPSTQEKKICSSQLLPDPYGGEPLGEPPPRGSGRAPAGLSEEVVEEALAQARLRRSVAGMSDEARGELIDVLLDQLRGERDELPDELRERLLDGMIDELIAGKRGEREILGQDGVLGEITRRMVQRALEEELTEHLGYPAGQAPPGGVGNSRNGGTPKTLLTDQGRVQIDTPRDRKSRFEPQLVKKGQRRLAGLDEKIIALYAGGMTTREIETYISELYGPGVSRETVSRVTAAVLEDAKAWHTRPLEAIYPILYLDALVIKIRDGQAVRNFACYLAIGVNLEGDRDVLGTWFQHTEGAKFWLQVLTDLKQRGVQDVLICCVDGLQGFPEAIEAVYPNTWVQTCIVHLIRNSLKFVPYKDRRQVAHDLKPIYTAVDRDHAWEQLERFAEKWDHKYPMISHSWTEHWERVVPFLAFPPEVRRAVYTTNTIEALNRSR
jgi:putative transposase